MNIKKKELALVWYNSWFQKRFIVESNMNLLLNTILIYGSNNNNDIPQKVDFDIKVRDNKQIIYPLGNYEIFFITGQKIINETIIKIKATDYIDKIEDNGNFTFTLKDGVC